MAHFRHGKRHSRFHNVENGKLSFCQYVVPPVNYEISAWWPRLNMLRISSSKQIRERFYVLANSAVLVLCGHFERKLYTPYKEHPLFTGCDPLNQKFRKFRSNWMGRFGPTGKVSKKPVHLWRWTTFSVRRVRSKWTVLFDHSDPFSIRGPHSSVSSMDKMEGNIYHCTIMDC